MINERAQYTANTGIQLVYQTNTNIDGSGALASLLVGASNGTLVRSITVKGTANMITRGMIRLYIYDGSTTGLFTEIEVPATTGSSLDHTYSQTIDLNFNLKSGWTLMASTNNGGSETFNISVDALDWSY